MWKSSVYVWRSLSSLRHVTKPYRFQWPKYSLRQAFPLSGFAPKESDSATVESDSPKEKGGETMTFSEAKRLLRLVNVESLKRKLEMDGDEVICYSDLLKTCESMGVARSPEEAAAFARVLDDAGVVLLFRDKVYLHPDKVVELVKRALPLALTPENDPKREELKILQKKKEEIDNLAHKQVHRILWSGLVFFVVQVGLFFRLTFWEFSWDVMEPIAFFGTSLSLVIGYAYFLFTLRDPTYRDLMHRLFVSRQRKLIRKHNFNIDRFMELQKHCKSPLDNVGRAETEIDRLL